MGADRAVGGSSPATASSRLPLAGTAWYWAALARAGEPLLHVADWHVPLRSDPLLVKGDGLWAEHTCDAPMEQWTVANETYAAALDDPDDALGGHTACRRRCPGISSGMPRQNPGLCPTAIEQAGVVHGVIELGGADPIHLGEAPAHRWHRWGDQLGPRRAPRGVRPHRPARPVRLPRRTIADWVLTPDGWRALDGVGDR